MKKLFAIMLTLVLLVSLSISTYAFSDTVKEKLKGTIVLYLNNSKAFVNGTEKMVDSSNSKVFPVLIQNNTLIPLRFVSESLNAQVKWDAKTNTATIILNGSTVKIKTGSTTMLVNGKEAKLSVPAKDIEDRLFIPLRAVAEAFGKKVFWDDRGLIIISDKEKPLDSEEEITEVVSFGKYDKVSNAREALSKEVLEKVIKLKYDNVSYLGEGVVLVEKDYKYGFLDNNTGKEITDLKYDDAWPFSGNMAPVRKDDKWGFIDKTGEEIIEFKYDDSCAFSDGLARVVKDGKFGFVDETGKEAVALKYDYAEDFDESLAMVRKDKKCGFVDKTGKEVIELKYDYAGDFDEGLARVCKESKWTYIDKTGKEITELKYDFVYSFSAGLAVVIKDKKHGYIDRTGKEVIEVKYDYATSFISDLAETDIATVEKDGCRFFINKEGQEVDENGTIIQTLTNTKTIQSNNFEKGETKMINMKTDKGSIKIEIYPELMPITTENFVNLVKKGFYDGLIFHRIEDWVIQGGDPKGNGTGGSDKTIKLETDAKLKNIRGAVAMARSSNPDSASSQFYILKTDADWLDGKYAVFGNVVEGMDIVDNMVVGDKMIKVE